MYEDAYYRYGSGRYSGYDRWTSTGNHVEPTTYKRRGGSFSPVPVRSPFTGGYYNFVDIPNLSYLMDADANTFPFARNKAWSALVRRVRGETVSLGEDLAEAKESAGMIKDRFLKMGSLAEKFRQCKSLEDFNRLFGPKPKGHRKPDKPAKDLADLWLEYSFGWSPLLSDVFNASKAMAHKPKEKQYHGIGTEDISLRDGTSLNVEIQGTAYVRQGGKVTLTNPNWFALQQLGLANPALVGWEIIPYSFLVDWVADVGSFLGSWTDFLGVDVSHAYTTVFWKGRAWVRFDFPLNTVQQGPVYYMLRDAGLSRPLPNLDILMNIGQSAKRAANAAALLVQRLTSLQGVRPPKGVK